MGQIKIMELYCSEMKIWIYVEVEIQIVGIKSSMKWGESAQKHVQQWVLQNPYALPGVKKD